MAEEARTVSSSPAAWTAHAAGRLQLVERRDERVRGLAGLLGIDRRCERERVRRDVRRRLADILTRHEDGEEPAGEPAPFGAWKVDVALAAAQERLDAIAALVHPQQRVVVSVEDRDRHR